MRKLVGFALGTLLSLGAVTSAAAAGTTVAAPANVPPAGIEVIVVTAKRTAEPVAVAQPVAEFVVLGKRAATAADRMPPAMTIEMPKLELAIADSVVRL